VCNRKENESSRVRFKLIPVPVAFLETDGPFPVVGLEARGALYEEGGYDVGGVEFACEPGDKEEDERVMFVCELCEVSMDWRDEEGVRCGASGDKAGVFDITFVVGAGVPSPKLLLPPFFAFSLSRRCTLLSHSLAFPVLITTPPSLHIPSTKQGPALTGPLTSTTSPFRTFTFVLHPPTPNSTPNLASERMTSPTLSHSSLSISVML